MTTTPAAPVPPAPAAAKPAPPTEFPPPVRKTIQWLNSRFRAWYAANPPPLPDRFTRREFGYIPWPDRPGPPPFVRHLGFDSQQTFHESLARSGPHSVYYSTAYYRRPAEMKMLDKQWLGAELIFDLDADHLAEVEAAKSGGTEIGLAEQLALVKIEFVRLLDDYLFGDFGLSSKDVWITFSGGRGYHAHVTEERLMQLGSKERREIVDYIRGKFPIVRGTEGQLDMDAIWRKIPAGYKKFGTHITPQYRYEIPTSRTPGWGGRLTRAVWDMLERNVFAVDERQAVKWLASLDGIGGKKASRLYKSLSADRLTRIDSGQARDSVKTMPLMDSLGESEYRVGAGLLPALMAPLYQSGVQITKVDLEGETDEPVTADVKRLIRLPGSLHGKSGLRVVILTRDQLDDFVPLRDAVAFPMDPVRFTARKDQEATLGGERVAVKAGEATDVPEAHAVFWCARQSGTVQVAAT